MFKNNRKFIISKKSKFQKALKNKQYVMNVFTHVVDIKGHD